MSKNLLLLVLLIASTAVSLLSVTSAMPAVGRFFVAEFPSQLARLTEYRATALIPAASAVAAVAAPPPDALGTAFYAAYYA